MIVKLTLGRVLNGSFLVHVYLLEGLLNQCGRLCRTIVEQWHLADLSSCSHRVAPLTLNVYGLGSGTKSWELLN